MDTTPGLTKVPSPTVGGYGNRLTEVVADLQTS